MYEGITYEIILKRLLDQVRETAPDLDTREGSVIFTAFAPAAVELQNMYIELDYHMEQFFSDTQDRGNLIRRCKEQGIIPYPASKAVFKGEFNMDIPMGSRFSSGTMAFKAIERIESCIYKMECETSGLISTSALGSVVPIEYIAGLTKAELTEVLSAGADEEGTEHLRERYHTAVQKPSTSGNVYDYYNWAMECPKVGAAKVFPLADGPGTVKVVVTNGEKRGAGADVIKEVTDHIEKMRPVGAALTAVSAVEKQINVSADVKLQAGVNLGAVQNMFSESVEEHLKKYALQAVEISIAVIGDILINLPGVLDYKYLQLNDRPENVELTELETPVMGTVKLEPLSQADNKGE